MNIYKQNSESHSERALGESNTVHFMRVISLVVSDLRREVVSNVTLAELISDLRRWMSEENRRDRGKVLPKEGRRCSS